MSDNSRPTTNPIHAILAELGIIDPISIATAKQQHAEVIAAYENGKLNEAALRQSIVRTPDRDNDQAAGSDIAGSVRDER